MRACFVIGIIFCLFPNSSGNGSFVGKKKFVMIMEFADRTLLLVCGIAALIAVIFGTFGNTVAFFTLQYSTKRASSSNVYLRALAIGDLMTLLFSIIPSFLHFTVRPVLPEHSKILTDIFDRWGVCLVIVYIAYATRAFATYIIVIFSVERYATVIRPFQASSWFTPKTARRNVLFAFLVAYTWCLPGLFSKSRLPGIGSDPPRCKANRILYLFLNMQLITSNIIPVVVVVMSNTLTVIVLRRRSQNLTASTTTNQNNALSQNENQELSAYQNEPMSPNENQELSVYQNEPLSPNENQELSAYQNEPLSPDENQELSAYQNELLSPNQELSAYQNEPLSPNENQELSAYQNEPLSPNENQELSAYQNESLSPNPNAPLPVNQKVIIKQERRVTRRLLIVSTAFAVLTIPIVVVNAMRSIDELNGTFKTRTKGWANAMAITMTLWVFNFSINFALYCLTWRHFRNAFYAILTCNREQLSLLSTHHGNRPRHQGNTPHAEQRQDLSSTDSSSTSTLFSSKTKLTVTPNAVLVQDIDC